MYINRRHVIGVTRAALTPAALSGSVAVVTQFAVLTGVALRVVQTPETGACLSVT